jgi:uncharacterized protein
MLKPLWRALLAAAMLLFASPPAAAQDFPKLSGRVVDAADIIPPAEEAALTQKLQALETASSRQLVVATVPSLQDYPIEDYGYRLGRAWGIGQKGANNGLILLVAPTERKVRIEVGYGLEPIVTDALSGQIIRERITPAFKAGDYPGGIAAGVDALAAQLQAPPEQAEQAAIAAAQRRQQQQQQSRQSAAGGVSPGALIFWGIVFLFVILPLLRGGRRGRRYRRGGFPVILWGPGLGGGGGGGGGGGWGGGGGGSWGGGGGGFSGGGGSFGGGGASGGW